MEINTNVAKGYVMNSRSRRSKCEEWSEWLGLMPMGKAITATELSQILQVQYRCSWRAPSPQAVSAMLNAVKGTGAVTRMEVAIEPYEIEVERPMRYDYYLQAYVPQPPKKITIDKKTVFIRMV